MGNRNSTDGAKGAGKDVIQQTQKSSHDLYELVDIKNGGRLIEAYRRAQATKDFTEVDTIIGQLKYYLYDGGNGRNISVEYLVSKRENSRQRKVTKSNHSRKCCCHGAGRRRVHSSAGRPASTVIVNDTDSYNMDDLLEGERPQYRQLCWNIEHLGAVGESLLHLCFLNASRVHYELAKRLLIAYPKMIGDIYICDEYYGENCLHMAIVNEDLSMVHFLCKNGIDIHERAYGAFFCPEDQQASREDEEFQETVVLSKETNYESNTYWGEYPLSFAACLGQVDTVKYLLQRRACPNKQDTNGNTVLHMVVIHDRQDMYDLLLDYGCYCGCPGCSNGIRTDIINRQGLTPLTLSAKLARQEIFHHIVNKSREVFWEYGGVMCAAFPLENLDTIGSEGRVIENAAVNIIIHEDSRNHLQLIDGIVHNILTEKWHNGCQFRFFQLLGLYVLYLLIFSAALYLRPAKDPSCVPAVKNMTSFHTFTNLTGNWTVHNTTMVTVNCDPCYLTNSVYGSPSQSARVVLEVLAIVWALSFLVFLVIEMVLQGFKTVALGLVYNPIRGLFALSCAIIPLCMFARFTCSVALEDHLTVVALVIAWPYSLMFCKGFALTGPYVVMIYQMLKRDFLIFFIIYIIFVIGFSQAMFLVMLGYGDNTLQENLFTRWFASGLGLIIMSLGEFGELHGQLLNSTSPFKIIGMIIFFLFMILGALLIVNMLIAMMGNTYLAVAETEKEWTRQWGRIVLATERMLTPRQKLSIQHKYSEPLGINGKQRALIMRLRQHINRRQSKVSHSPKQCSMPTEKEARIPKHDKNSDWLNR